MGGLVGGAVGLGGRLLAAMPKNEEAPRIDPFAVREPWRHSVIGALQARIRFEQASETFRAGPLRDAVERIGGHIDDAVEQCWQVARQADLVAGARSNIDDQDIERAVKRLRKSVGDGQPNDTQARTLEALQSQADSAGRLDQLLAGANDRLDLLNARLDQSVTQAIELSVSNRIGDAEGIGADVGAIVDELEALRLAMEDVQGSGTAGSSSASSPSEPPPLPRTDPPSGPT